MNQRPQDGWQMGRDSLSKLVVKFRDGNIRTFYSLDWSNKRSQHMDYEIGLIRLEKLVAKFGNKALWGQIEQQSSGNVIKRYKNGIEIMKTP